MVAVDGPVVLLYCPFAIISCATAAHIAHERFQAVETGALLAPRYYPPLPAQALQKRQSVCHANQHPCMFCRLGPIRSFGLGRNIISNKLLTSLPGFELGDVGNRACCSNDK